MSVRLYKLLAVLLVLRVCDGEHRSKRYYGFINPAAPFLLGFILNIPMSIFLPTLVDTTIRQRRSQRDSPIRTPYVEDPDNLVWEPTYEDELGRLQVFFNYLQIFDVPCQEKLICEVAASPETYAPLAKLMLRELRQTHGPVKPSEKSLFWRYLAASATGYAYSADNCAVYYPKCVKPASKMLNMPVLKVWQYLSSLLNLNLV